VSCKDNREKAGLSFYWDAFGIEEMVREKIVSSSFGGLQALNADTWCWG